MRFENGSLVFLLYSFTNKVHVNTELYTVVNLFDLKTRQRRFQVFESRVRHNFGETEIYHLSAKFTPSPNKLYRTFSGIRPKLLALFVSIVEFDNLWSVYASCSFEVSVV